MTQDKLLYHYTSVTGLNGILSTRTIWASDCRYLNDQKELVHAIELFLNRFEDESKKILGLALHWYSASRSHCVFSLSQSPNVLSQWRAYGDDGRGAAIGFHPKYLTGIGNSSRTSFLVDCIYSDHENFLDGAVEACKEDIEALRKMYVDSDGAANSFMQLIDKTPTPLARIYAELLKIKNPAFQEEQEVRLVISAPLKKVQTRVTNGLIIPYIEYQFVDDGDEEYMWCIAPEIWLGPRCDKRNEQAIRAFGQFGWDIHGIKYYDCGYI